MTSTLVCREISLLVLIGTNVTTQLFVCTYVHQGFFDEPSQKDESEDNHELPRKCGSQEALAR
jgi:hypothetical protein